MPGAAGAAGPACWFPAGAQAPSAIQARPSRAPPRRQAISVLPSEAVVQTTIPRVPRNTALFALPPDRQAPSEIEKGPTQLKRLRGQRRAFPGASAAGATAGGG